MGVQKSKKSKSLSKQRRSIFYVGYKKLLLKKKTWEIKNKISRKIKSFSSILKKK